MSPNETHARAPAQTRRRTHHTARADAQTHTPAQVTRRPMREMGVRVVVGKEEGEVGAWLDGGGGTETV